MWPTDKGVQFTLGSLSALKSSSFEGLLFSAKGGKEAWLMKTGNKILLGADLFSRFQAKKHPFPELFWAPHKNLWAIMIHET
jgi:hypothetical protein